MKTSRLILPICFYIFAHAGSTTLCAQQPYWEATATVATDASGQRYELKDIIVTDIKSGNTANSVVIATDKGIFSSADNGKSWIALNRGLSTTHITAIIIESSSMYATAKDGKIFFSKDNGSSWSQLGLLGNSPPPVTTGCCLLPAIQKFVPIMGTENGIYASVDAGKTWALSALRGSNINAFIGLTQASGKGEILFAATSTGLYKNENHSVLKSQTIATHGEWIIIEAVPPANATSFGVLLSGSGASEALFTTSSRGLFKSLDGGVTWQPEAAPSETFSLNYEKIKFSGRQAFLVGNSGTRGIIYKKDFNKATATWVDVTAGLPAGKIQALGTTTSGGVFVAAGDVTGDGRSTIYRATALLTSIHQKQEQQSVEVVPHPISGVSTLNYTHSQSGAVRFYLTDMLGRRHHEIYHSLTEPGRYSIPIDLSTFPAGIYFYTLETSTGVIHGKIIRA